MDFKFLVATKRIKGLPGLEVGDAVVRASMEILPGGYEYDVWHRLDDGTVSKTRVEHRDDLELHVVSGETREEVIEAVAEVSEHVKRCHQA